ncbi:MAG: hypothetical protein FIA98_11330 [Anaerolineae bacterium]|nr:hypothetical protein [Anaerolineae bacterium]
MPIYFKLPLNERLQRGRLMDPQRVHHLIDVPCQPVVPQAGYTLQHRKPGQQPGGGTRNLEIR